MQGSRDLLYPSVPSGDPQPAKTGFSSRQAMTPPSSPTAATPTRHGRREGIEPPHTGTPSWGKPRRGACMAGRHENLSTPMRAFAHGFGTSPRVRRRKSRTTEYGDLRGESAGTDRRNVRRKSSRRNERAESRQVGRSPPGIGAVGPGANMQQHRSQSEVRVTRNLHGPDEGKHGKRSERVQLPARHRPRCAESLHGGHHERRV